MRLVDSDCCDKHYSTLRPNSERLGRSTASMASSQPRLFDQPGSREHFKVTIDGRTGETRMFDEISTAHLAAVTDHPRDHTARCMGVGGKCAIFLQELDFRP
ncbi:hypothetical protein GCM10027267_28590 [Paramicrobacterium agarici]